MDTIKQAEREVIIQVAFELEAKGHVVKITDDGLVIVVDNALYVSVL